MRTTEASKSASAALGDDGECAAEGGGWRTMSAQRFVRVLRGHRFRAVLPNRAALATFALGLFFVFLQCGMCYQTDRHESRDTRR
jgi:hypothetical protein